MIDTHTHTRIHTHTHTQQHPYRCPSRRHVRVFFPSREDSLNNTHPPFCYSLRYHFPDVVRIYLVGPARARPVDAAKPALRRRAHDRVAGQQGGHRLVGRVSIGGLIYNRPRRAHPAYPGRLLRPPCSRISGSGPRGGRHARGRGSSLPSSRVRSASETRRHTRVVWALSALALTGVFLVIGQWVDARLAEDDNDANNDSHTPSAVGTDYGTVALQTCFQIVFDVAMLLVPYVLLRHYAPHTLLYRHYLYVVFPLWVVSLQAQPLLKERLRVLLAGEVVPEVDDAAKLTKLVAQAEADKAQAEADEAKRKRRRRSATSGATAVTEGFIRGHTRLPPSTVRAQRLQPDSRGVGMDTAPWSSFQQEADQTVQFSSPLLDGGGGQVAAPPPSVIEPFEFSGKGGEAAPRHTDLSALMG